MKPLLIRYKNLPIKSKLLVLFVVQVLLPMSILGYLISSKTETVLEAYAIKISGDVLQTIEKQVGDFLKGVDVISQDLLYDQELYDVLNDNKRNPIAFIEHVNDLKNILRKKTLAYDSVLSITVISKDKDFYTYDSNSGRANIERLLPYQTILPLATAAKGGAVWFVDHATSAKHIYLIRLLNDRDTYNPIGMIAILVDMEALKQLYEEMNSDLLAHIAIVSKDEEIIFNSRADDTEWLEQVSITNREPGVYVNDQNEYIGSYSPLTGTDWYLVTGFSKSAITGDIQSMIRWVLLLMLPIIFSLSILTTLVSNDMSQSIGKIVMRMKSYKQGVKEAPLEIKRTDEIGFLASNFEQLIQAIEYLMNNIYKEQLIRKEVQLKALQAQINPHFLFNTLETINWHAQMGNSEDISEMVTALSAIMDATMTRTMHMIPFKEELVYIGHYLTIMSHRYGERLRVTMAISELSKDLMVPQLILQPIIENALMHGIAHKSDLGRIHVQAKILGDVCHIMVTDNGEGIKEKDLDRLKQDFNLEETLAVQQEESTRIGLRNVYQRLKLVYGDGADLALTSRLKCYTRVHIQIPLKESKGDPYVI